MNTDKKIMFKETNADRNSLKETLKRLDTETDGRYFSIDYQ